MWKTFSKTCKKRVKQGLCSLMILSITLSPISFCFENLFIEAKTTIDDYPNKEIKVDTVWTQENGPYILESNLIIASGTKLKIESDTIVRLNRTSIYVNGELEADGVIFTSIYDTYGTWDDSDGTPSKGDWGNIRVNSGGTLKLKNSELRYGGEENISMVKKGFIKKQEALAFTKQIGVIQGYNANIKIENSKIINNIIGLELNNLQSFFISQSTISDNDKGIVNNGETEIDARNIDWGDASGPYHSTLNPKGLANSVSDKVLFDPWIGKPEEIEYKDPIIIVPGIVSSVLYNLNNEEVWPNIFEMMIPGEDKYLEQLMLDKNGLLDTLLTNNMRAEDILRKISNQDFFDGLIKEFERIGYIENKDLFVFPYDWRYSVSWASGDAPIIEVSDLKNKIANILENTDKEKVNVIAHSMGGLVVKDYIDRFGTSTLDHFIDIATPHLGAPKAFKVLTYGDDMGFNLHGFGLSEKIVKKISQNFPSIYELLPSQEYFKLFEAENKGAFIVDIYDFDQDNKKGNLNYNDSLAYMINTGRNGLLIQKAKEVHEKIDQVNYEKAFNIIACGKATLGKTYILKKNNNEEKYALQYVDGDGTVPTISAESFGNNERKFYTNLAEHPFIPSAKGIKEMLSAVFDNDETNDNDYQYNENISKDKKDVCGISGTQVSFHSPIKLHIYDQDGNHVGPNENDGIDLEIPGVAYDIIEGNKFAFIPAGLNFRIEGEATATGTFDVLISKIDNDEYLETVKFENLPIDSINTFAGIEVSANLNQSKVYLDQNGDNIFENNYVPNKVGAGYIEEITEQEYILTDLENILKEFYERKELKKSTYQILNNELKSIIKQKEIGDKVIEKLSKQLEKIKWLKDKQVKKLQAELEKLKEQNNRLINKRWENYLRTVERLYEKNYVSEELYDIIKNIKIN